MVTAISWTDPRTWLAGEIVTAAVMNTHVRDNLNAILTSTGTEINSAVNKWNPTTNLNITPTTGSINLNAPVGGGLKFIRKTVDETLQNSTVLQDDDDLSFSVGTSEIWIVDSVLFYRVATADHLVVTIDAPSGSAVQHGHIAPNPGSTDPVNTNVNAFSVSSTGLLSAGGSSANDATFIYHSVIQTSGSTGNVTLRWAQENASTQTLTVRKHSYIRAYRIS